MSDRMIVQGLYAAMIVSDLAAAEQFYAKVFSRPPDDRPLDTLIQWRGFGSAGIQLFKDAEKAGNSRMTIVVADIAQTELLLKEKGIELGDVRQGHSGKIAQLGDPDGNNITFAEPPKSDQG